MSYQNEEDYLDSLLNSIVNNQKDSGNDLYNTDSDLEVPETFLHSGEEVSETSTQVTDDSIYDKMLFNVETSFEEDLSMKEIPAEEAPVEVSYVDEVPVPEVPVEDTPVEVAHIDEVPVPEVPVEDTQVEVPNMDEVPVPEVPVEDTQVEIPHMDEVPVEEVQAEDIPEDDMDINPMAELLESEPAEGWKNSTVGDLIDNAYEETDEAADEDKLIDEYINKVLSDESDDSDVEEKEEETENIEYIDVTNEPTEYDNELISALDDIISNISNDEDIEDEENSIEQEDMVDGDGFAHEQDLGVDYSNLDVDNELKDLLGVETSQQIADIKMDTDSLSEEELRKIEQMSIDSSDDNENQVEELLTDDNNDLSEGSDIADLLSALDDAGIDSKVEDLDADEDVSDANENNYGKDSGSPKDKEQAIKDESVKEKKKEGFLAKLFGGFKKKSTQDGTDESKEVNENEKLLNEMFDENGELIGEDKAGKKKEKKGLFSLFIKKEKEPEEGPKALDPVDELDLIPDISEIEEKPSKKKGKEDKKEKEPKEKKEKKKKEKKVKTQKVKEPVDPSQLISIKPVAIIIMLVLMVGIVGYIYIFTTTFTYRQSIDQATYYMVDKEYTKAFDAISGLNLKNEEDEALYNQIKTIMQVQKQYNSYERYNRMGMHFEALDALIMGLGKYDENYVLAGELSVSADLDNAKVLIVNALQDQYGITEAMARTYMAITDYEQYVYIINSYKGAADDSNN